jgi:hypothetical protein
MSMKRDWKCVAWDLERIFRKQFAPATSETSLTLNQTNNMLNLTDGAALQEARRALDEVQAQKAARRQSIEAETIVAKPTPQPEPEPEPSPQSPTPTEPVERWRDKHPIEPSLRQKLLAQSRRMGRSDGEGKGIF